ncbi:MAG: hypothetical protein HQL64_06995 [Magnetococcales bacterium]|nr:hypothetical protein [Magnetococcales bacterium]
MLVSLWAGSRIEAVGFRIDLAFGDSRIQRATLPGQRPRQGRGMGVASRKAVLTSCRCPPAAALFGNPTNTTRMGGVPLRQNRSGFRPRRFHSKTSRVMPCWSFPCHYDPESPKAL